MSQVVSTAMPTFNIRQLLGETDWASAWPALPAVGLCCATHSWSTRGWSSNVLRRLAQVAPQVVEARLLRHAARLSWQGCALQHLANTTSQPPAVTMALWARRATQGKCSNGNILPAAIMLGALAVQIVVILPSSPTDWRPWETAWHTILQNVAALFS